MAEAIVTGVFAEGFPPVDLRWADGEISGNGAALKFLAYLVERNPTVSMTPTGPWYRAADVYEDGWAFIAVARVMLRDATYSTDGLPPYAEPVTGDAVVS